MSIHISAEPGEIAPIVLMPGDPLRAKYIAENMLTDVNLVSRTRNIYYYTGTYNGKQLTVGASGMGIPSIGIYSYELYNDYNVECIIRVGTCGSYMTGIKLYDLINVDIACSESTYASTAFEYLKNHIPHQGKAYDAINDTAKKLNMAVRTGAIHSGDAFYRTDKALPEIVIEHNCLAAEMEAFALFANAQYFEKTAATLLTVSDIIRTHERMSADERERSLDKMINLALESCLGLD
ncbi:MAG TPA: purine-nucleoside phosphorylase [Chitinophagaceae bacterium]|nr:purine-nucleoside phosphorylase [Chitinophagaceae bacterium]